MSRVLRMNKTCDMSRSCGGTCEEKGIRSATAFCKKRYRLSVTLRYRFPIGNYCVTDSPSVAYLRYRFPSVTIDRF